MMQNPKGTKPKTPMMTGLKSAFDILADLTDQAEEYKRKGGRKAGTILSKCKNGRDRCSEGMTVLQSVIDETVALGMASPLAATKAAEDSS